MQLKFILLISYVSLYKFKIFEIINLKQIDIYLISLELQKFYIDFRYLIFVFLEKNR